MERTSIALARSALVVSLISRPLLHDPTCVRKLSDDKPQESVGQRSGQLAQAEGRPDLGSCPAGTVVVVDLRQRCPRTRARSPTAPRRPGRRRGCATCAARDPRRWPCPRPPEVVSPC